VPESLLKSEELIQIEAEIEMLNKAFVTHIRKK